MNPESILIFTDGASKGNPGPGGFGAVIAFDDTVQEIGGREERTTNNRMELRAAIEALQTIHDSRFTIQIYSDSAYLINGITKWVHGWKKNGWKTTMKKDVENRDLWESLDRLSMGKRIEWQKVAGHADTPGNARADEIASAFGDDGKPALYSGPRSGYKMNLSAIGAREGSVRSRTGGAAYSYVSLVDGVVMTHKTWKECEARVKGKSARYKKVFTESEEKALISEFNEKKKTD